MNTEQDGSELVGLCHVGMHAKNPATLAEFYRDVMGMQVVGGSDSTSPFGASVFLSSRPGEESHEIAMFANPQFAHHAFKMASLGALKSFYQRIIQRGIPVRFQFLHGVSFAFYFQDPEGNMIEVYWPTGVNHPQPCGEPIDLTRPEAELLDALGTLTGQTRPVSASAV
jgi:catechol-2,3-dioxygenase